MNILLIGVERVPQVCVRVVNGQVEIDFGTEPPAQAIPDLTCDAPPLTESVSVNIAGILKWWFYDLDQKVDSFPEAISQKFPSPEGDVFVKLLCTFGQPFKNLEGLAHLTIVDRFIDHLNALVIDIESDKSVNSVIVNEYLIFLRERNQEVGYAAAAKEIQRTLIGLEQLKLELWDELK